MKLAVKQLSTDELLRLKAIYEAQKHEDTTKFAEEAPDNTEPSTKATMPDASDVSIADDGTHEACKGVHSHSHTDLQGDDHTHEHSHDGDASHSHLHSSNDSDTQDDTKSVETLAIIIDLDPVKQYQLQVFNNLGATLFGEQWKAASPTHFVTIKEGRAISAENTKKLKEAHDILADMGGSEVCSNTPANDGNENDDDGVDDGDGSTKSFEPVLKAMEQQTIAVMSLVDALKTSKHIEKALEQVELVNKEVAALNIKFKTAKKDVNAIADTVQALKDMPVGDPRNVKRSLNLEGEAVTDLKDMLPINQESWTLEQAVAKTSKATKTLHDGSTLTVRVWPAGVGKGLVEEVEGGVRPELSRKQKILMSPMMWLAYNSGDFAEVPLTPGDDPEEVLARQAS